MPVFFFKPRVFVYLGLRKVFLFITFPTFEIFQKIFNHRQAHNKDQRKTNCWNTICDRDLIYHLHTGNQYEKHIGCLRNLMKQIQWDEIQKGIG